MAKSARIIAEEICSLMEREARPSCVILWGDFYATTERQTMRESFKEQLKQELRERAVLINYGETVVSLTKDYPSPTLMVKSFI